MRNLKKLIWITNISCVRWIWPNQSSRGWSL